jgi:hypothetical protein
MIFNPAQKKQRIPIAWKKTNNPTRTKLHRMRKGPASNLAGDTSTPVAAPSSMSCDGGALSLQRRLHPVVAPPPA